MKRKTVMLAFIYALVYFFISGLLPLISQVVTQLFNAILDFEPRTVQWLFFVGIIMGILVFIEKIIFESHPSASGTFGILRYVVGLIDVTLYYNLLLHVGIIVPTIFPTFGVDPTNPFKMQLTLNLANNNVVFALYLVTLGLLIYGSYALNFFRYIFQIAAGYRLTDKG